MTGVTMLRAARELSPLIRSVRDDTERDRRLPPAVVEGLRQARLCRMAVAAELNGLELPMTDMVDVLEELAGAEASVGWIVWNNMLPCLFGRYLAGEAREEVFADAAWLYASSTRPTGRAVVDGGGYRVEGRWSLVSGCELAEWLALMCIVEEDGAPRMLQPDHPELRLVYVRRADCEILDTWHVGGLRGTGSHDVVAQSLHAPAGMAVAPGDPVSLDSPVARLPIIATLAAAYGALTLGVARTALDTLVALARTKVSPDPAPAPLEGHATSIPRQTAALGAARSHLKSCAAPVWEQALEGREGPDLDSISTLWAAAHHAVDAARETVERMYAAGGSSSLYTDCPLERAHRDLHAMLRHIIAQSFWIEDAARVRLGRAPNHPLFAV